jgi:hypothetical protein
MSSVLEILLALAFGLMSLVIVLVAATLNPNPAPYLWFKREVFALVAPFRRTWVLEIPMRMARAAWIYVRLKLMARPGRLDLTMFGLAIGAVTTAWDAVALKALDLIGKFLLRHGWI